MRWNIYLISFVVEESYFNNNDNSIKLRKDDIIKNFYLLET